MNNQKLEDFKVCLAEMERHEENLDQYELAFLELFRKDIQYMDALFNVAGNLSCVVPNRGANFALNILQKIGTGTFPGAKITSRK